MRIISGKYKGRRLTAPKNLPVRPTTDQAKEALFNILWNRIDLTEISVLDLYSGTGNISYEFASQGTKDITAIDSDFGCVRFIRKTSDELGMGIKTVKSDALSYLNKSVRKFDLIFADPPYHFKEEDFKKIIETVFENDLLNEKGVLILEHSKHTDLSDETYLKENRRYGGSVFSFFGK